MTYDGSENKRGPSPPEEDSTEWVVDNVRPSKSKFLVKTLPLFSVSQSDVYSADSTIESVVLTSGGTDPHMYDIHCMCNCTKIAPQ